MADKGPFLTSCIIFYLFIGGAIFQILEERNWISARDTYIQKKEEILRKYTCLTKENLNEILEVASQAAGQGVAITGDKHRNSWDWSNSVIFAATIVTTIGYGKFAPKTNGGKVFCILYGLCGIPLCLVWLSSLGSFFGDRARRLSQVLLRKGVTVKKVQFTLTALFLLWGLLVHLVIPPFIFMAMEEWSYLEGMYFSFITLTTVGFGDYVTGVNPDIDYPRLYRAFAELWVYMGLAWLSLFFSWNVHMVVEAHKVFKKKRQHWHRHHYHHHHLEEEEEPKKEKQPIVQRPTVVDIFSYRSKEDEDYSTIIKEIGLAARRKKQMENINRSKSCSDLLAIEILEHSPVHRRNFSFDELCTSPELGNIEEEKENLLRQGSVKKPELTARAQTDHQEIRSVCSSKSEPTLFSEPATGESAEKAQHPSGAETRFRISKVPEKDLPSDDHENG